MPHRAETSRRLKAARWLAGGVDAKGKPDELKREDLALRSPLPENGITANRLHEIEQMKIAARPMELDRIAEALGLPHEWFTSATLPVASAEAVRQSAEMLGPLLDAAAQAWMKAQEQAPQDTDAPDHPGGAQGADA